MNILKFLVICVFAVWWLANCFFSLPDTSLPIVQNYKLYKKWDAIAYQRWGFFAPPPDYDDRLYYVYTDLTDSTKITTYEVFENLQNRRRQLYPFDDDLSNLDYILHNLSSPIGDLMRESYEIYKLKGNCLENDVKSDCFHNYIESVRDDFNNSPQITTLLKHAKIIAKKKNLDNSTVQIIIGAKDLPKFKDRFNNDVIRQEYPFFKSNLYNLNTEKWEKFQE